MFMNLKKCIDRFQGQSNRKKQESNSPARKRTREHEAGWTVLKKGKPIAEFSFIRIDPPFYLFKFTLAENDLSLKQLFAFGARQAPDSELVYQNRSDRNLIVVDELFLAHLFPDEV